MCYIYNITYTYMTKSINAKVCASWGYTPNYPSFWQMTNSWERNGSDDICKLIKNCNSDLISALSDKEEFINIVRKNPKQLYLRLLNVNHFFSDNKEQTMLQLAQGAYSSNVRGANVHQAITAALDGQDIYGDRFAHKILQSNLFADYGRNAPIDKEIIYDETKEYPCDDALLDVLSKQNKPLEYYIPIPEQQMETPWSDHDLKTNKWWEYLAFQKLFGTINKLPVEQQKKISISTEYPVFNGKPHLKEKYYEKTKIIDHPEITAHYLFNNTYKITSNPFGKILETFGLANFVPYQKEQSHMWDKQKTRTIINPWNIHINYYQGEKPSYLVEEKSDKWVYYA